MKKPVLFAFIILILACTDVLSQESPVHPAVVRTGVFLGVSPSLRDLPALSDAEWAEMRQKAQQKVLNPELENRSYPFASTALPAGPDPVWQDEMGKSGGSKAPILNFDGQTSPYYPPDPCGTAGPSHYMQTINTVYAIYNKSGTLVAGPTNLNLLFGSVPGATCNDGDPIILYDEQADRWLVAEFSLCTSNDRMLIAVSTTNDPTGTWYQYSFDVDDMPDYEKFGVWQDGYYMGTNNTAGNDIYVFQRSQMLTGGTAQMVGFDNPWRPGTIDGFMCVPPVDSDGPFAPAGSPGLFITINDDAIGGGSDQIWIYELSVNWTTPSSSTFTRTQTLNVSPFDSNFGVNWDNIKQPGTTQELDAIPQVILNVPQYRNFGDYQTLVCCHTVDVDNTDHAGVRWYELRRTTGPWSIRQQSSYAPDAHSRWMGSIMLNTNNEIGLAYSVSSTTVYPSIRYTGQSQSAYNAGSGTMDLAEDVIWTGTYSQTTYNRWGDYTQTSVDPSDNATFWYTNMYISSTGARKTRIASFTNSAVTLNANFFADNTEPLTGATVQFSDLSIGAITSRTWSFSPSTVAYVNGTSASSKNPAVQFSSSGAYTVSLLVSDGSGTNTETRTDYIHAGIPGLWTGVTSSDWNTGSNWDNWQVPASSRDIMIPSTAPNWPSYTGNLTIGTSCNSLTIDNGGQVSVTGNLGINAGKNLTFTETGILNVGGDWLNYGTFNTGTGTVQFTGSSQSSIPSTVVPADYLVNYIRATSPASMTLLTAATTGPTGDNGIASAPIGFTVRYAGTNYTSAVISTNGWISLNGSSGTSTWDNANLFATADPNTTLAPWWDDLNDDNTSSVSYKTEGSAPNRVFTTEWNRVKTYIGATTKARISFQVKLYETTNVIEFSYGAFESGTQNAGESASIGLEDATGGISHFIEATTGSTTVGLTNLVAPANWPAVNYTFTPPPSLQTFYNLSVNKNNSALVNQVNVVVNGNVTLQP